eukprot:644341-Pyramimonas_sp.AAC.1
MVDAMVWSVDKVVRVRAPYMASPIILEDCRELNGCVFFHLKKSCDVVMKLLGHPRSKGSRPLVNRSSCETVERLRDDVYRSSLIAPLDQLNVHGMEKTSLPPPGSSPWKKRLRSNHNEIQGTTTTAHGPTMGDIKGTPFEVITDRPGTPLYVQLEEDLAMYLKACCESEIKSGAVRRQHPSEKVPAVLKVDTKEYPGPGFSYTKGQFVLKRTGDDGHVSVRLQDSEVRGGGDAVVRISSGR